VEVLVVVSLLSLIVLALMAVFNSTQKAFRTAATQTDVMEGSRSAMGLITTDLRTLTPSGGVSNVAPPLIQCPVNFFSAANNQAGYQPLMQNLPGLHSSPPLSRANVLNYFFILGRENTKWTGIGYAVNADSTSPLYPLYRFYAETNIALSPQTLFDAFYRAVYNQQWTNLSHVMDGVVHLTVHAQDPAGRWINNSVRAYTNAADIYFLAPVDGESQLYMFSNTVPASVEIELGVIEDNTLARAESQPDAVRRTQYLNNQVGKVHLFRQRVSIPNVDFSAYQP
jgi:hypothetical protein